MKIWKYTYALLILTISLVIITTFQIPDTNLHVIACDVGQGDAILTVYKNIQILTDGGPDQKVLNCLGKYLPFYDKEIELVILTHPDADHSTGLIDVVKKYKVDSILLNQEDPGTEVYRVLENALGSRGVRVIESSRDMQLRLGLIQLDILSQFDPQVIATNANSIVYKLKFANFLALFPGDIPQNVSDTLLETVGHVDYIKIPHHGSKNGLTENLLKSIVPKIATISVAAKNPWGFPSTEILQMLKNYNVEILRTDETGDLEVITDGEKFWWKK